MASEPNDRRLAVIGAGGHAKVVIEVARAAGWTPVAALDPNAKGDVLGVPIVGADSELAQLWQDSDIDGAVVAVGDNQLRSKLAGVARAPGCPLPVIVHPSATISPTARLGDGTVVMAGAVINAAATIGRDCIVNTGAIIEHDCALQDGVHAAPRTVMGGACRFGAATLFGIGAVARPGVTVGAGVTIGAGAVVVSDLADGVTAFGNLARPVALNRAIPSNHERL